jgi:ubiquinone/menaquinone biosynthesis C-methylase UbiE
VGKLEDIPFHERAFDVVICSAVLHFAESVDNFWQMIQEIHRVLKPGGIFWFRMTTAFGGILAQSQNFGKGKYGLPDGSERFLFLPEYVDKLENIGFKFLEPMKTVLIPEQREMGIVVMEKI